MRALVWNGPRDVRVEERAEPTLRRSDEAIVEVAWCGICGTDIAEYRDGPHLIRPGGHPLTGVGPPLVLGHEMSGRVVDLGSAVAGITVGQRVVVDPCWSCGHCYFCRRGDYHICAVGGAVGLASDGALARYVKVPISGLVALPDQVSDDIGALVEPLSVALHAVRRGDVGVGDTVVITGYGPIGAASLLAASSGGAGSIRVVEPSAERRALAVAMGATSVHDPADPELRRQLFDLHGRVGADVVIDCSGVSAVLPDAVGFSRRGGRIVLAGIGHGEAALPPASIVLYERSIVGSLGYRNDLPRVVALLASERIDPSPLITARVVLEDAVGAAFEMLDGPMGAHHMKVLIDVAGGTQS